MNTSRVYAELWEGIEAYAEAVTAAEGDRGRGLVRIVAEEVERRLQAYAKAHAGLVPEPASGKT